MPSRKILTVSAYMLRPCLFLVAFVLSSCASDSAPITLPSPLSGIPPGIAPASVSRSVPRYPQSAPLYRYLCFPLITPFLAKPGEGAALRPVVPAASSEVPVISPRDTPIDNPVALGFRGFSRSTGSSHEPHPRPPFHGIPKAPRSLVPPGFH